MNHNRLAWHRCDAPATGNAENKPSPVLQPNVVSDDRDRPTSIADIFIVEHSPRNAPFVVSAIEAPALSGTGL